MCKTVSMIGTQELADIVATTPDHETPKGFTRLGSGAYRVAYLGPDGVVYKQEWDQDYKCNANEAETFQKYSDSLEGEGFRLAMCTLYGDILAMEYIEDDWKSHAEHPAARKMSEWAINVLQYWDVPAHGRGKNWFIKDEVIVLTDYQDYSNGY